MKKMIVLSLMLCGLIGCGEVVEQNQVALVLRSLGERTAETVNVLPPEQVGEQPEAAEVEEGEEQEQENLDNFTVELITARRVPLQLPGTVVLRFPLGLQSYRFTGKTSLESLNNEAVVVDVRGGRVSFDIVVHLYIDPTFPDLERRLVKLMKAYQLRQYAGDRNVLEKLISGRFSKILRKPFVEYAADKNALEIMRKKPELNEFATNFLNDRFNPMGLRFTLVAVSSAMTVSEEQQKKMNDIYLQDVRLQVLELTNTEIKPLDNKMEVIRQEGETEAAKILNEAEATSVRLVTEAEKSRKQMFVSMLGRDNYIQLETMLTMVEGLKKGKPAVNILPSDSRIILNNGGVQSLTQVAQDK